MAANNKEDDKKNITKKVPRKKSSTINYNLIGLVVISIAAFFGFGAIFSQMQLNIGAQASSAAFAALFILLSTKFLMEKESENNLKNEKANKVFAANLPSSLAANGLAPVISFLSIQVELSDLLLIMETPKSVSFSHNFQGI